MKKIFIFEEKQTYHVEHAYFDFYSKFFLFGNISCLMKFTDWKEFKILPGSFYYPTRFVIRLGFVAQLIQLVLLFSSFHHSIRFVIRLELLFDHSKCYPTTRNLIRYFWPSGSFILLVSLKVIITTVTRCSF